MLVIYLFYDGHYVRRKQTLIRGNMWMMALLVFKVPQPASGYKTLFDVGSQSRCWINKQLHLDVHVASSN